MAWSANEASLKGKQYAMKRIWNNWQYAEIHDMWEYWDNAYSEIKSMTDVEHTDSKWSNHYFEKLFNIADSARKFINAYVRPFVVLVCFPILMLLIPYYTLRYKMGIDLEFDRFVHNMLYVMYSMLLRSITGCMSLFLMLGIYVNEVVSSLRISYAIQKDTREYQLRNEKIENFMRTCYNIWHILFGHDDRLFLKCGGAIQLSQLFSDLSFRPNYKTNEVRQGIEFARDARNFMSVLLQKKTHFVWSDISQTNALIMRGLHEVCDDWKQRVPYNIDIYTCTCLVGGPYGKSSILKAVHDCVESSMTNGISHCAEQCKMPYLDSVIFENYASSRGVNILDDLSFTAKLVKNLKNMSDKGEKCLVLLDDIFRLADTSEIPKLCESVCKQIISLKHYALFSLNDGRRFDLQAITFMREFMNFAVVTQNHTLVYDEDIVNETLLFDKKSHPLQRLQRLCDRESNEDVREFVMETCV